MASSVIFCFCLLCVLIRTVTGQCPTTDDFKFNNGFCYLLLQDTGNFDCMRFSCAQQTQGGYSFNGTSDTDVSDMKTSGVLDGLASGDAVWYPMLYDTNSTKQWDGDLGAEINKNVVKIPWATGQPNTILGRPVDPLDCKTGNVDAGTTIEYQKLTLACTQMKADGSVAGGYSISLAQCANAAKILCKVKAGVYGDDGAYVQEAAPEVLAKAQALVAAAVAAKPTTKKATLMDIGLKKNEAAVAHQSGTTSALFGLLVFYYAT